MSVPQSFSQKTDINSETVSAVSLFVCAPWRALTGESLICYNKVVTGVANEIY